MGASLAQMKSEGLSSWHLKALGPPDIDLIRIRDLWLEGMTLVPATSLCGSVTGAPGTKNQEGILDTWTWGGDNSHSAQQIQDPIITLKFWAVFQLGKLWGYCPRSDWFGIICLVVFGWLVGFDFDFVPCPAMFRSHSCLCTQESFLTGSGDYMGCLG